MNKKLALVVGFVTLVAVGAGILVYRNSLQQNQFDEEIRRVQSSVAVNPSMVVNVQLSNYSFSPQVVKIKRGAKVIWTNKDNSTHSVMGYDNVPIKSPAFAQGGTFEMTFDTVGVYRYHCSPHPFMTGAVIVAD